MSKNQFMCDCGIIHPEAVKLASSKMPSASIIQKLTTFYKLIGDSTRCKICFALNQHEMCVCDLSNVLSMSKSSVSHQLKALRDHHIVKSRSAGKEVYYTLDDDHVQQIFKLGLEHINHQKMEHNL